MRIYLIHLQTDMKPDLKNYLPFLPFPPSSSSHQHLPQPRTDALRISFCRDEQKGSDTLNKTTRRDEHARNRAYARSDNGLLKRETGGSASPCDEMSKRGV